MSVEKIYKEITHSWEDIWEGKEINVSYRLARPTTPDINRMQAGAVKNAVHAARTLLLSIVHDEDKDKLVNDFEKYPALVTTIAGIILKSSGLADLGNG